MNHPMIDIGANLAHDSFDQDRDEVIAAAQRVGVEKIVITGSSEQSSNTAAQLATAMPQVLYGTAGMHPHHASDYNDAVHARFAELLSEPHVVAVGECGLDYFRDFSPRDAQREAFERQLELAVETGLPVFLHERDAHDDYVAILKPYLSKISRGVAHCFTGSAAELRTYLDLGLYIGITGWICDERRGKHLLDLVGMIPKDRLMIETDAPYLMPRTLRPKPASRRNEPQYLPEVLRTVANATGRDIADVAKTTYDTTRQFFAI